MARINVVQTCSHDQPSQVEVKSFDYIGDGKVAVSLETGFAAKCRVIAQAEFDSAEFDSNDLVVLAFLLGRDAERLCRRSSCITRRQIDEQWPRHRAWQSDRDAEFLHLYGAVGTTEAPSATA